VPGAYCFALSGNAVKDFLPVKPRFGLSFK